MAREPRDTIPNPNGCRYCGEDKQKHVQQWAPGVAWHGWTEPTDEQRKARMLARRAQATPTSRRTA